MVKYFLRMDIEVVYARDIPFSSYWICQHSSGMTCVVVHVHCALYILQKNSSAAALALLYTVRLSFGFGHQA